MEGRPLSPSGESTPRSSSPESSSAINSSFFRASNTIDNLSRALAAFSRVPTPEPPTPLMCCCERENCEATVSWLLARSKLEKNLELSAEVGQALLQRHEAYVRRHEKTEAENERALARAEGRIVNLQESNTSLVSRLADLVRESTQLEKRIAQGDLNLEVSDASNRTLLKELQDTRTAMGRLTAQNARSIGWEMRLANANQERDDLKQEVEAERLRCRNSEAKATAAGTKCSELQAEVARLKQDLDLAQVSRADFSELLIQDARARLEGLQNSLGLASTDDSEVTRILESLVADNEAIKRDNAELQNLLAESREDLKAVREELSEHQAAATLTSPKGLVSDTVFSTSPRATPSSLKILTHSRARNTSKGGSGWVPPATALISSRGHRSNDSWAASSTTPASPYTRGPSPMHYAQVGSGFPWTRRSEETPAKIKRSRSIDSPSVRRNLTLTGDRSPAALSVGSPSVPHSAISAEGGDEPPWANAADGSPEKPRVRPRALMLLSRSRGVQTDGTGSEMLDPFSGPVLPSTSASRIQANITALSRSSKPSSISDTFSTPFQRSTASESSSINFSDPSADPRTAVPSIPTVLPSFIDRVAGLHQRISQADVRTLVNRFKRQHISGGDVGHLSKATLKSILADVEALRGHFKAALDSAATVTSEDIDGEPSSIVSRKDLRALLKLAKDLLTEMVQLRSVVNNITLDPSGATRLKDQALSTSDEQPGGATPPGEGDADGDRGRSRLLRPQSAIGWIAAPIQKLFNGAAPPTIDVSDADSGPSRRLRPTTRTSKMLKAAPKLAPAVSATTTTVNVEFGSTGTKGAMVAEDMDNMDQDGSGYAASIAPSSSMRGSLGRSSSSRLGISKPAPVEDDDTRSRNLLGIFAGAPPPPGTTSRKDSWVVIPSRNKADRRSSGQSMIGSLPSGSTSTPSLQSGLDGPGFAAQRRLGIGHGGSGMRATAGFNPNRLSRIVDAVIDDNASIAPSEHGRTLRARGLSDSSMHSTFVKQSPVHRLLTPASVALSAPSTDAAIPSTAEVGSYIDRQSVFRALSRKVQSFAYSSSPASGSSTSPTPDAAAPVHERQGSGTGSIKQRPAPVSSTSTPPGPSPPRPIPSSFRNSRASQSSSQIGSRREPSPGGRMLSFMAGVSWIPGESASGTPIGSVREDSPLNNASKIRRETRGGMDFV